MGFGSYIIPIVIKELDYACVYYLGKHGQKWLNLDIFIILSFHYIIIYSSENNRLSKTEIGA